MSDINFKPAWWLKGPHRQTIWPALCRRRIQNLFPRRERFELADGDFVDLDWVGDEKGPIVIILHGLEGSIKSVYMQGMLQAISREGWRGACMHFRSCSGERNRLSRIYHSGETLDLAEIINQLQQREPHTPLAAIGFSLGGNVLLKWLGETGSHNPLVAAVAISVPFELAKVAERIQQGFSRIYQRHLLNALCKKIKWKFQHSSAPFTMPSLKMLRTLRDFDDLITAPLHGFLDADDYYAQSSSRQYLKNIDVPTLLLQAKDDPLVGSQSLPMQHEMTKQVMLELTETGGHVGFISGNLPWRPLYWLEKRVPLFFKDYLTSNNKTS